MNNEIESKYHFKNFIKINFEMVFIIILYLELYKNIYILNFI